MPNWKKVIVSGSDASLNSLYVTNAVTASIFSGSFTGSLFGTASFAVTSSYITASNVFGPFGSNSVISSSYAVSASQAISSSYAFNATSASYAFNATSASYTLSSSYAATASSALNASDVLIYVKNSSGAQINKGTVVRISGAVGDNPLIETASYINDNNSANTLGITNETIANDSFGYVMTEGKLLGIDTSAFTVGQLLYLGATGSIIGTAPVAPLHSVRLGQVLRVQLNNGSMYVRIDNGYELGELHDVVDSTTTSSYGDLLVKSGSVWVNSKQLTGSYGLTGSLTFVNGGITGSLQGTSSFAIQSITSSYADSFTVKNNAVISGSLTILQNLTVFGSASITYVSESTLNIGTNLITVNTNTPAVRFGGLAVIDSGSSPQVSGSWLFDSIQDRWIFVHQQTAGGALTSSIGIMGPETYNSLGSETQITLNRLTKGYSGVSGEHIGDSQISDDGTTVSIPGRLNVTGSITGSLFGTSSYASQALSSSYAVNADNAGTIDVYVFGSNVDSYLLMSNVAGTTGVAIGGDADLRYNASTNRLTVGNISATTLTGSLFGTASFALQAATASYVLNAVSASFAQTASLAFTSSFVTASNVFGPFGSNSVISSSFAVSASRAISSSFATSASVAISSSYAFDATSASFAISASHAPNALTASFAISASQAISSSYSLSGSYAFNATSASYAISSSQATTASYAIFALSASNAPGYTTNFSQSTAATTWSFSHNLNTRNPLVQVYSPTFAQLIPNEIVGIDAFTVEIRFDYAQAGYAVASNGGGLYVTGSTPRLVQNIAAVTWSFAHNLGTKYPGFEVYDSNDNVVTPAGIHSVDANNAEIYFAYPTTGVAIANFSGISGSLDNAISASYATYAVTASYSDAFYIDQTLTDYATVASSINGSNTVFNQATGSFTSAFFKYTVASGSNSRSGEVMSVWNGASAQFTDNSTVDIGVTTAVTASVIISGANVRLNIQTNTAGWRIKSLGTFM